MFPVSPSLTSGSDIKGSGIMGHYGARLRCSRCAQTNDNIWLWRPSELARELSKAQGRAKSHASTSASSNVSGLCTELSFTWSRVFQTYLDCLPSPSCLLHAACRNVSYKIDGHMRPTIKQSSQSTQPAEAAFLTTNHSQTASYFHYLLLSHPGQH